MLKVGNFVNVPDHGSCMITWISEHTVMVKNLSGHIKVPRYEVEDD